MANRKRTPLLYRELGFSKIFQRQPDSVQCKKSLINRVLYPRPSSHSLYSTYLMATAMMTRPYRGLSDGPTIETRYVPTHKPGCVRYDDHGIRALVSSSLLISLWFKTNLTQALVGARRLQANDLDTGRIRWGDKSARPDTGWNEQKRSHILPEQERSQENIADRLGNKFLWGVIQGG